MRCLVYGVVFSRSRSRTDLSNLPSGVAGAPVGLIEAGDLAAAVTRAESAALTPTVGSAMAYAKVVEALHASGAVLPMRYGCVLSGESDVIRLLRARADQYVAVLRGLEGCVEMGIRMLVGRRERDTDATRDLQDAAFTTGEWNHLPGAAYLARRTSAYAEADRHAHEIARRADGIRAALDGLFLRSKTEDHPTGTRPACAFSILTLSFLVRRESLALFRQVCHQIDRTEPGRFLLSGPWPPYNFVELDGR